jgi:hypothetical protein
VKLAAKVILGAAALVLFGAMASITIPLIYAILYGMWLGLCFFFMGMGM